MQRRTLITEIAVVATILLIAAVLRIGWPGLTEFKADEARLIKLSFEMAEGQAFPLRGISSSVGIPNFPVNVWIYALPLVFWSHVYAPTIFTGLLNVIAVGLCYWFVRRYWGWQAAVAATLMFAVSPWAIIHSRKIWAQNLLPIFVMGWGISAALCLVEKRPRWMLPLLLCAALAFQIHLAAVSLFPATLLLLIIFRRNIPWKWVAIGTVAAFFTAVPFLYYLDTQADLTLTALLSSTSGDAERSWFSWNALTHTIRLATGWELHALAGPAAFEEYLASLPPGVMLIIRWFWGLLMIGGLVMLIGQAVTSYKLQVTSSTHHLPLTTAPPPIQNQKSKIQNQTALLLLIWLLSTVFTFLIFPTRVELHYLIPTYPTLFIAAGIAAAQLASWLKWRLWLVLSLSAAGQIWAFAVLLVFVSLRATPGGYGTPLRMQLEAVDTVNELYVNYFASEVIIAGIGEEPLLDEFAAVYDVLLRDLPLRYVNLQDSAVFPTRPAIVLTHPAPTPLQELYRQTADAEQTAPLRPGEGSLSIFALPAAAEPSPQVIFDDPLLLSNWVNFLGYDPPAENGLYRFHWQVGDATPVQFHFFNHINDFAGQRITQLDKPTFDPDQWRPGDRVVSLFILQDLEKGLRPLTLRTGMYVYPTLESIPLLDEAANPYADAVDIELPLE